MKFLIALAATASISGISMASPAPLPLPAENAIEKRAGPGEACKGHAHLENLDWHASGGGYNRWKFAFAGFNCGEFHDSMNRWSLPNDRYIANRQCWDSGDGITFYMEFTTTKGEVVDESVAMSVKAVTGQGCADMALPDWGVNECRYVYTVDDTPRKLCVGHIVEH